MSNVLLIGNGGREHALALKLKENPRLKQLFIAPGNPGTAALGKNIWLNIADHAGVIRFCQENAVDLVVVGPEAPLVDGLADDLEAGGIAVFGPSRAAAQLEGSKDFTKMICMAANVPTAASRTFTDLNETLAYLREKGAPIVIKYDGLMAGKGVTVAMNLAEAEDAVEALHQQETNAKIVIEEMMVGEEVSFFCLVDGDVVVPFGSAQDHKRAFDGDEGPNTGGMGAYSPAPVMDAETEQRTLDEIILPSMQEMARRGTPYRGVLFAGLMITAEGPKLIEYNCRFGDPECQVLMLRLETDLLDALEAVAHGKLREVRVRLKNNAALGVVMASQGYPGDYQRGSEIRHIRAAEHYEGVSVFHAGTRAENGHIFAHGGRVLTVCAEGKNLIDAQKQAYMAVQAIEWKEGFYRRDIGAKGVKRA